MSPDLALRLLPIIEQLGIKSIIVIGGEPTIWKHLLEFNRQCRQAGIQTTLVTNAYRFSNDEFWAEYMENPNDKVSPSIKAFDEESAKRLAQIPDLEIARKGLGRVLQKFDCGVSFVLNSFVKDDLVRLAQFARLCGAPRISISPCTPSFSCDEIDTTGMLTLQEIVEAITSQYQRLHELMEGKLALSIKTPLCLWPKDFIEMIKARKQLHSGCQFQGRSGVVFGPQGELLACNSMAKFPIGELDKDYTDAESLLSLLNSDQVTQSYDHINSYPSEKCIGCPQINSCGGGCPLIWTVYDAKTSIPGW
jgi:radical SAM protein with 4Fe4S-binding SPASM domain